jgi:hypothetical protein
VEGFVHLLRLPPGGRAAAAEPVRLVEVLPIVGALLRRHRGLEDLRVRAEADADPLVSVRWGALVRLLLLVVARVGHVARGAGGMEVEVRIGSDGAVARVEVSAVEEAGAAGVGLVEAVRGEVEAAGGTVVESGGAVLLSFPLFGV